MANQSGLILLGKIQGIRPRTFDKKIMGYELGVEIQRDNGFGGMATETKIVRVSEDQQAAVQNAVNKLQGKDAYIFVYEGAFAGKRGAIAQLNYQPDSPIIDAAASDPFGQSRIKAA